MQHIKWFGCQGTTMYLSVSLYLYLHLYLYILLFLYLFAHLDLLSTESFSSDFLSSDSFSSLPLPASAASSVHIVGSLTSKLPSAKRLFDQHEQTKLPLYLTCAYLRRVLKAPWRASIACSACTNPHNLRTCWLATGATSVPTMILKNTHFQTHTAVPANLFHVLSFPTNFLQSRLWVSEVSSRAKRWELLQDRWEHLAALHFGAKVFWCSLPQPIAPHKQADVRICRIMMVILLKPGFRWDESKVIFECVCSTEHTLQGKHRMGGLKQHELSMSQTWLKHKAPTMSRTCSNSIQRGNGQEHERITHPILDATKFCSSPILMTSRLLPLGPLVLTYTNKIYTSTHNTIMYHTIMVGRRKFRSQTSDNMERWKSSQQGEESEEKRSEERRCRETLCFFVVLWLRRVEK